MKNATRDPRQIERWWQDDEFNIGVAAGCASGITVVDIDSADAANALARLAAAHGALPRTVLSRTPRGYHLFFHYVPALRNRVRAAGLALDVRNDGGYVVAPPSSLSDDELYTWLRDPLTTPVAVMPEWLSAQLHSVSAQRPTATNDQRTVAPPARYGLGALRREAAQLSRAAAGTRNHALNCSAFRMGSLIDACGLSEAGIKRQLVTACEANGLIRDDGLHAVERTIGSGLRAGRTQPRKPPAVAQ